MRGEERWTADKEQNGPNEFQLRRMQTTGVCPTQFFMCWQEERAATHCDKSDI